MPATRRRFFVVAGSLVPVSLAGCLGDDDGDESDVPADDQTGDDETDDDRNDETGDGEQSVAERIDAVEAYIGEAGGEIELMLDHADPIEGERLDTQPVEQPLDRARDELDAARPDATEDELETIEALDNLLEFLDAFLDVLVELDSTMAEFNVVDQFIAQDRWEEAIEPLEKTDDAVTRTHERLDDARATFQTIDPDPVDGLEEIELAELEDQLDELDELLFVLDGMVSGLVEVARGIPPFDEGVTAIEAENWEEAQEPLAQAAEHFGRAEEHFDATAADASAEFHGELTTFACQWGHFQDAAAHFENMAVAFSQDDDETAESELEAAEDALTLANQCEGVTRSVPKAFSQPLPKAG